MKIKFYCLLLAVLLSIRIFPAIPPEAGELQKKQELQAVSLSKQLMRLPPGKKKKEFAQKHVDSFMKIFNAYYPRNFKYQLKGKDGIAYCMTWMMALERYDDALKYFDTFKRLRRNRIDKRQEFLLVRLAMSALLRANRENDAKEWLKITEAFSRQEIANAEGDRKEWMIMLHAARLSMVYDSFATFYGERGNIPEAEQYARLMMESYKKRKYNYNPVLTRKRQMLQYNRKYNLFREETIHMLKLELKQARSEGKDPDLLVKELKRLEG